MSIADASAQAAGRFDEIVAAVRAYIVTAKTASADGLTWQEFGELLVGLLRVAIKAAEVLNVPGHEKKAIVLEAVAALFDSVADRAIPTLLWPLWLVARASVRQLVLALAAGAVEQLLPILRA